MCSSDNKVYGLALAESKNGITKIGILFEQLGLFMVSPKVFFSLKDCRPTYFHQILLAY